MKTIIEINQSELREFKIFADANENWNILSYLNHNYSVNEALAFAKLFFPDFTEVEGCVVLSFFYNEENFKSWNIEFDGDVSSIEKMSNLYELKDFFHINEDDSSEKQLRSFGEILKASWQLNLKTLFPLRSFEVVVFEEYDSIFITFFTLKKD